MRLFDEWKNRTTTQYNSRVVINLLDADPVEEVVAAAPSVPEPVSADSEVQELGDALDVKLQNVLENGGTCTVPL